jgi:hypothetical protein
MILVALWIPSLAVLRAALCVKTTGCLTKVVKKVSWLRGLEESQGDVIKGQSLCRSIGAADD